MHRADSEAAAQARRRIEQLRAEARYHADRYALYRARAYGPRPTSATRMRELEQAATAAERRLRHAEDDVPPA